MHRDLHGGRGSILLLKHTHVERASMSDTHRKNKFKGLGLRVSSWAMRRPKSWSIQVIVATLDTPRSCITSKVARLTRFPGSGGPSLSVTVGTLETKVTTLTRISGVYRGRVWGGGRRGRTDMREVFYLRICVCVCVSAWCAVSCGWRQGCNHDNRTAW